MAESVLPQLRNREGHGYVNIDSYLISQDIVRLQGAWSAVGNLTPLQSEYESRKGIFTAWRLDEKEKMISLGKLLLLFHYEEAATSRNVLLSYQSILKYNT